MKSPPEKQRRDRYIRKGCVVQHLQQDENGKDVSGWNTIAKAVYGSNEIHVQYLNNM